MNSKSPLRISAILVLLMAMFSVSACNASGTKIEFTFNTSSPANSSDEKIIYLNNDIDKLVLNAALKIDSGDAIVQVLSADDELLWSGNYQKDSDFIIELNDVKANNEYLLKIETTQSKEASLIVTSNKILVKEKEKPDKF